MAAMETQEQSQVWPAACRANGWVSGDKAKRLEIVRRCMELVRGPQVTGTSDPAFGDDETTALFTHLIHLAAPGNLNASARWVQCQEDYRAFNRAQQADWHERELYGDKKNRWDKNRFAGAASAKAGPLDKLNPDEVRKRHLTFATRHQAAQRLDKKGQDMASQTPATIPAPCSVEHSIAYAPGEEPF